MLFKLNHFYSNFWMVILIAKVIWKTGGFISNAKITQLPTPE
jgi:hypothetical protein